MVERRQFGKTDMNVSILGFGGSEIGRGMTVQEVDRLLGGALDAGLNVIDTAECYLDSEELIGSTISHRRDDYYLFTKCGHASGLNYEDWDPALLEESIDRSLKRLRTDYVDVIHLHTCSLEALQRGEVIKVLKRAKEQGKTRYIGYSGDSEAALYAVQTGLFDSLETSINIADQEAIDLTIPEAVRRGIGVIAKRPIANVAWSQATMAPTAYPYPYWARLKELQFDFISEDIEAGVENALRFTLSTPGVHTAIVGTTKPSRWLENTSLINKGPLTQAEYDAIRSRWNEVAREDWIGQR